MTPKTLSFKCALITGGGGGLGYAMAEWLLAHGKRVIIAGRTESKLASAAKSLGHDTPYYVLDTGDVAAIPSFVGKLVKEHPEVDCVINNAGVQRVLKVDAFDLAKADSEIDINIRGPIHLAVALLPHLRKQSGGAVIMNVTSVLGFIPFSVVNPVYNATKAFGHFWTTNLRTQINQEGWNIKVVEVVPPQVESDLHRDRDDPDDNKKAKSPTSLSVEEFIKEVGQGWESDLDVVSAGPGKKVVDRWYDEFGADYVKASGGK
ncbi:MAG: hypothetical protein M1824_006346 [Vezdaea acicularis]|nr:MAG: hypothetical protein M1824_006346 [Vezdaea acicularis]